MTEDVRYAIPGERHQRIPEMIPEWTVGEFYVVLPWLCFDCDQVVAETFVSSSDSDRAQTVLVHWPSTRVAEAELGVPFYGPTRRMALKGSSRRGLLRSKRGAMLKSMDYQPIVDLEFDTVCDTSCGARLRISLPRG